MSVPPVVRLFLDVLCQGRRARGLRWWRRTGAAIAGGAAGVATGIALGAWAPRVHVGSDVLDAADEAGNRPDPASSAVSSVASALAPAGRAWAAPEGESP